MYNQISANIKYKVYLLHKPKGNKVGLHAAIQPDCASSSRAMNKTKVFNIYVLLFTAECKKSPIR